MVQLVGVVNWSGWYGGLGGPGGPGCQCGPGGQGCLGGQGGPGTPSPTPERKIILPQKNLAELGIPPPI